jgi:ketosteroid isomerase-like protein
MARTHVELVYDVFERWNRGERDPRPDEIEPDFEVVSRLTNQVYRGAAGIRDWVADVTESFDQWNLRLDEVRELGDDRLLGLGRLQIRGRGSGVDLDQPAAWLFQFRGGRMARMETFLNRVEEALAEADLA